MSESEPIYDFKKFKATLELLGYRIEEAKPYVPLEIADVNLSNIQNGEVEITSEGIYYINPVTGYRHQIFLYKKSIYLEYQGKKTKPKMHIVNCDAIQSWGREQYRRANTGTVLVWDKSSRKEVSVSDLPLCSYCRAMLSAQIVPTSSDDFEMTLREAAENKVKETQETDLKGYLWDWHKLSSAYRAKMNYTCERCGFTASTILSRQYIHVHHKDGNKLNNSEDNLECLCIACHANVDNRHRENFTNGRNKINLDDFKRRFPDAGPTQ